MKFMPANDFHAGTLFRRLLARKKLSHYITILFSKLGNLFTLLLITFLASQFPKVWKRSILGDIDRHHAQLPPHQK